VAAPAPAPAPLAPGDFDKAKAFLMTKEGPSSLYDHLTEVILKVITEQPRNAVATFEQVSALVKAGAHPPVRARARHSPPRAPAGAPARIAASAHLSRVRHACGLARRAR
jgi:hypothetical protein